MANSFVNNESTEVKKRLANLVKDLRGNETQRQFAKRLGISYTSIQDWEKQIRLPSEKNLKRIAQLQGWGYEQLVRFLFASDTQSTPVTIDSFELIMSYVDKLTTLQKQQLRDYLTQQISEQLTLCQINKDYNLSPKQKHNLHLLLRASLKNQDPLEAIEKVRIEPDLFADIFLRNDQNRQIGYQELKQFSSICCQVIQWRNLEIPEVNPNQTYKDRVDELWQTLSGLNACMLTQGHKNQS